MVTDEEIREVCAEWVRGEHFPIQDGDEQQRESGSRRILKDGAESFAP